MKASTSVFGLLSACLCLILPACGTASTSSRHTLDLRLVALQKSDVPKGFSADPARYWSDQQAAARDHVSSALYVSHGRVLSYSNGYTLSVTSTTLAGGLARPASEITAFKNRQGAHWYLEQLRHSVAHAIVMGATTLGSPAGSAGEPVPFKSIRAPQIGEEHAAFSVTTGGDEVDYTTTVILWRRSNVVAALRVRTVYEEYPFSKIVAMARRIDARIASRA